MKLTQRLFLFFFITLFSTSISVYLLSNQFFLRGFIEIEDRMAFNNLHRIANVIAKEQASLHRSASSWSSWDETYNYVESRNPKFVRKSLETPAVFETHFTEIHLANLKNEIILSRHFDFQSKKLQDVDPEQIAIIQNELLPFLKRQPGTAIHQGLFVGAKHTPYILSVSPILDSFSIKPSRGYFIVLREMDTEMKRNFSELLRLDMNLSVGNNEEWTDRVTREGVLLKSDDSIQGLIAVDDILKQHKLVARLDIPRFIYLQGRTIVFSFMMIIGFFLTVSFGFVFFGFHKDVLSKILKLKKSLNEIGNQSNELPRIPWEGRDEIAELTQNINAMLDRLEKSQVMVNRASKFSALGEMAGSIAHEINNPLAIITGFCTRLIRSADKEELNKEEVKETANRILKTSYRIERIIKSLRLVSRDGERDTKTEVVLGDILDEVISLSDNKLNEYQIELKTERFDREQKVNVRFVQIVQVLLNLLTNSTDAISELNEKWIEFQTEVDENTIHILVTDSGHGIRQDIAEKIMDPFFTTKELGRGTGLGLSISKGIIESHGGAFQLVRDTKNTCFKISIPRTSNQ